jgi:hypothetical protein
MKTKTLLPFFALLFLAAFITSSCAPPPPPVEITYYKIDNASQIEFKAKLNTAPSKDSLLFYVKGVIQKKIRKNYPTTLKCQFIDSLGVGLFFYCETLDSLPAGKVQFENKNSTETPKRKESHINGSNDLGKYKLAMAGVSVGANFAIRGYDDNRESISGSYFYDYPTSKGDVFYINYQTYPHPIYPIIASDAAFFYH